MAGKRRELLTVIDAALVDSADALVRERKVVPRAKLPRWSELAPGAQEALVDALLGRGLEAGDKGSLRVPLFEQVAALGAGGARIDLGSAQGRVAGATSKEREAAIAEACKAGVLHLVVRGGVETVIGGAEDVLAAEEIDGLARAHAALGAVLKQVRKEGATGALGRVPRTLLREDAAALLTPFSRAQAGEHGYAPRSGHVSLEAVVERIRSLEQPPILLVWIPDLVRSLATRVSTPEVHRALFELRARGLVELRPEPGEGQLAREDEGLVPAGEGGIPLAHVLRL